MKRDIHSITDLVTGPVDVGDIPLYHTVGGWKAVKAPTFDVKAFGAAGDGTTDDVAKIQAAIDACAAAGGGTVYFPKGIYRLIATTSNVLTFHLLVRSDYVRLVLDSGAELRTTVDAAPIFFAGVFKPGIVTGWSTAGNANARWFPIISVHTLSGTYAKSSVTLTLATPADAANYAAGDIIMIKTGQTTSSGTTAPDGEFNMVQSVNVGAGTITLTHPTSKPYAQEYFITGTTGITSTSVTANLAPYGIANLNATVLRGCGIEGGTIRAENLSGQSLLDIYHVWDFDVIDTELWTKTSPANTYGWQLGKVMRNKIHLLATSNRYFWPIGATCQGGIEFAFNKGWSANVGYFHFHEGAHDCSAHDNTLINTGSASDVNAVSFRGRGYDLSFISNVVIYTGSTYLLYADATVVGGLLIDGNVLDSGTAVGAAQLSHGSQRFLSTNKVLNGWIAARDPTGVAFADGFGPYGLQTISNWVSDNNQNPTIGILPAYSVVANVRIQVTESFNSTGTDLIEVGYDADTDAFATATDVSTGGIKTVVLGVLAGYNGTARTVEAYYTNSLTEPTTGRALVVVEFYRAHREVL